MKQLFYILAPVLLFTSCDEDENDDQVSSTLIINNEAYYMANAFISSYGIADSNSASSYQGYKYVLDIYSSDMSYDETDGFEGSGFVISIQLFASENTLPEGSFNYSREQNISTYDNCNIVEYKTSGFPERLLLTDFGEINLKAFSYNQYTLKGTSTLDDKEIRFSYAGSFGEYP